MTGLLTWQYPSKSSPGQTRTVWWKPGRPFGCNCPNGAIHVHDPKCYHVKESRVKALSTLIEEAEAITKRLESGETVSAREMTLTLDGLEQLSYFRFVLYCRKWMVLTGGAV